MAEIFDLDAVYAEERGEPFRFRWQGRDWELPPFGEIDLRAIESLKDLAALADADETNIAELDISAFNKLLEHGLGPEQWVEWEKVSQPGTAVIRLLNEWQKHSGADVGEAPASTDSSKSTGRPSKRTSSGATGSGSAKRSPARKRTATRTANS